MVRRCTRGAGHLYSSEPEKLRPALPRTESRAWARGAQVHSTGTGHTTAATFQSAAARLCLAQALPQPFAAFPPSPQREGKQGSREEKLKSDRRAKGNSLILSFLLSSGRLLSPPQCYHCCNLHGHGFLCSINRLGSKEFEISELFVRST